MKAEKLNAERVKTNSKTSGKAASRMDAVKSSGHKIRAAAVLCLLLALGLAVSVSNDRRKNGDKAEARNTRVTKPYPRERDEREMRTKNPREEFEAARKRGLTEEEVRTIAQEYLKSGITLIDQSDYTGKKLLQRREKQQKWYLDILTEGMGLTTIQRETAEDKLSKALEDDFKALQDVIGGTGDLRIFQGGEGAFPPESVAPDVEPAERMFLASLWIGMEELSPWGICQIEKEQKDIVGSKDLNGEWEWQPWGAMTKDFETGERYKITDDPLEGRTSIIWPSGFLFPLSMKQVDDIRAACISGWDVETRTMSKTLVLDQVKFLTAPQLKSLMLFVPDVAEHLMKELGELSWGKDGE